MMREQRQRDRKTAAQRAVTGAHRAVAFFSRAAQIVAGLVMSGTGVAALYVAARRLLAGGGFGAGEIAFFALGAVLLLVGLGVAVDGPFWRSLGKVAGVADDVWDAIRGKPSG